MRIYSTGCESLRLDQAQTKPRSGAKYGFDLCPQGPKSLQASDIAPGQGLGFTRVLPQAPINQPQGPGLGRAGAWAWAGLGPGLGRAITVCAGNESKGN